MEEYLKRSIDFKFDCGIISSVDSIRLASRWYDQIVFDVWGKSVIKTDPLIYYHSEKWADHMVNHLNWG